MAYSQVRDLIKYIKVFHRQLCDLYENLSETETDQRLELLLVYMGRHERHIDQALSDYEEDAAEGLLATWLQYTSEHELRRTLASAFDEVEAKPDMNIEEIAEVAMQVDQRLVEFYRQGRDETSIPRVREFFSNLLTLEEGKEHRRAKEMLGIYDA